MADFVYKCVSVPSVIGTGQVGKGQHSEAVAEYEDIINEEARGGWELVQIDSVTSVQRPGCLLGLIGHKGEERTFKMLIYRKTK